MSNKRQQAEQRGRLAETLALIYLLFQFYWPVAVRAKTPLGEIDLIVKRGKQLVAVEVKSYATRTGGLEAVTLRQQGRIMEALQWWLSRHPHYQEFDIRCDVISLKLGKWPLHIRNAFSQ